MYIINRFAAIVKPKETYLEWILSFPDAPHDITLDEPRTDCTALLIPEYNFL